MSTGPLVSIIVPSFNQGRFIGETLRSILSQDYRPLEVLVLDGGSTDETLAVLESFGRQPELRWWSEPDEGVADAVNKGLERSRGEILGIQSSDDLYTEGAVRAAVEFLESHPEVALVYGNVLELEEDSTVRLEDRVESFDLDRYLGRFLYIPQPAAFFRAGPAREAGGWRPEVSYAADADLWLRIAVHNEVRKIDRTLGGWREHPAQRNVHAGRIARDWERAVRDLIDSGDLGVRTRRYARMGIHLAYYKYSPPSAWLRRSWRVYRALAANPAALFDRRFPRQDLLVGRAPVMGLLSRAKRQLGFKPRAT